MKLLNESWNDIDFSDLKVGDEVICTFTKFGTIYENIKGTIKFLIPFKLIGIEFEEKVKGHSGGRLNYEGKDGHCWNFYSDDTFNLSLKKIEDENMKIKWYKNGKLDEMKHLKPYNLFEVKDADYYYFESPLKKVEYPRAQIDPYGEEEWDETEYFYLSEIEDLKDFKVGTKLLCDFRKNGRNYYKEEGIIRINDGVLIGIEFERNIGGHSGSVENYGKIGHCWYFNRFDNFSLRFKIIE